MNRIIPKARVRLLIVDDDPLVRSGLRLMLGGADDIEVVAEASDGDELLAAVTGSRPDVVLLDIRMPRMDGIAALRELRMRGPLPVVLMLTTFHSDVTVREALRAGAAGYLLKHSSPAEIVEAVRAAAGGRPAVSDEVLLQLMDQVAASEHRVVLDADGARDAFAVLTDREREVALAVAEGLGNAEIAGRLYLSVGSVKAHVSSALTKLGIDNRIQLAVLAHTSRRRG